MTPLKRELAQHKEKLASYLDASSGTGIVLIDPALNILDCNQGFTRMFQLQQKPIGAPLADFLILAENDLQHTGEFQLSCSHQSGVGGILYCRAVEAKKGHLLFCERLIMTESRAIEQIGAINNELINLQRESVKKNLLLEKLKRESDELAREVRAREQALRESEKRFRRLADSTWEGILIHREGVILDANEAIFKMFGWSLEENSGKSLLEYLAPESIEPVLQILKENINTPQIYLEASGLKKDKTVFPIELRGKPIKYKGLDARVVAIRDLTLRKRAESQREAALEEVQKVKEDYRMLVDNASDLIYQTDENGYFTFLNPSALKTLGYEKEEIIGKHYKMVISPGKFKEAITFFANQLINKIPNTYYEYAIITKDGQELWIGQNLQLIMKDDRVTGFQSVARNITERKKGEEALRASEIRMRSITDTAHDAIMMIDPAGRISYWNPAAGHILGYTKAEAIGQNLHSLLAPPRYHAAHRAAFPKFVQTGQGAAVGKTLDLAARRKDGQEISVQLSLSAVQIQNEWHAVGILRDVTEQRRMENELLNSRNELEQKVIERTLELAKVNETLMTEIMARMKSEERYRLLADNSTDAIWTMTLAGKVTYVSPSIIELTGFTPKEALEMPLQAQMVESSAARVIAVLADQLQKPPAERLSTNLIEVQLNCKDGTIKDVEIIAGWLLNDRGEPIGIQGSSRDITSRKQVEEALTKSEVNYRRITENMSDLLMDVDVNGLYKYISPSFWKMLGYTPQDLLGTAVFDRVHPEDMDRVLTEFTEGIRTKTDREVEYRYRHADGHYIWLRAASNSLYDTAGEFLGAIINGSSITERKQVEDLLQKRALDLAKVNETLTMEILERLKSEEAMRISNAYNRSLLEANIDSVVAVNEEGKITDVNRATEEATGCLRDELIGTDFADYFAEPDRAQAAFRQLYAKGEVHDYDLQLRHKSGTILPVLYNASLFRDESGKVVGGLGVARDTTERKIAEWALKESEQRYRIIADNTYDWEFWLSPQHDVFYTSPSCERITGYLPQDFQQNPQLIVEIVHPEDLPGFEEQYYAEFKRDYSSLREMEFRIIHKDGSVRWIGHLSQPVFGEDGAFIGTRGSHRDITESKQAEEALRKSEARFKYLLKDVQSVAVQGYGPDGTAQYWNHASEIFYGYTAGEAIGRNLLDLIIPPEMRGDVEQAIRQMAETGQPIPAAELSLMRKDGSRLAVYSSHTIVQIPGQTQELFCIDIDMTDRKQAEQDRIALQVAQEASLAKGAFVSNMSHEIRTPLNAILGFAQVLERDLTLTPRQAEYVRTITKSGAHLLALIGDILDMSKIEAGRNTLNETAFCLHGLLDDMEVMFNSLAVGKGLKFLLERDESVPRYVTADEGKLRQIIINLLGNAVKFTQAGGVVLRVRAEAAEGQTEFLRLVTEVEDTGPGIPDEDRRRIFDPFQQAKAGESAGGTGLGLAISSKFVEMMGSKLTVKSQVGKGSCFRFAVLLKPGEEVAGERKPAADHIVTPKPAAFTPETMAALPKEIIQAMRQAVAEGNMARLTALIAQVEKMDSATARGLQALADQYDYEKLNQVLRKDEG